jgi:MotA/TolQ/ExbB proton channel family
MANPNVHLVAHDRAIASGEARAERAVGITGIVSRLYGEFSAPGDQNGAAATSVALPLAASQKQFAFLSRFVVLQAIGGALVVGLWVAGLASKPFEGDNAFLCWLIVAMAALGILCVFLQRWRDVQWLATHVVRIGLLGTVVGLIIAFSAARSGASSDPEQIRPMIAAVVDGMYVSLYATLLGIGTNLWLKVNLRLLGRIDG